MKFGFFYEQNSEQKQRKPENTVKKTQRTSKKEHWPHNISNLFVAKGSTILYK